MSSKGIKVTTLRDFGGGWNVADSETNLANKYQPVSDNTVRGSDGSISIVQGDELFCDMELVDSTVVKTLSGSASFTIASGSKIVKVLLNAHGLTSGQFITLTAPTTLGGVPITGTWRLYVRDANNFEFAVDKVATSAANAEVTAIAATIDNRTLKSDLLYGRYYNQELVVFTEDGEAFAINALGVPKRIWSSVEALGFNISPWGPCDKVSAEVIKGKLIACNGRDKDKPIQYDGTTCNLLVDGASLSNAAVPRAEFVAAADRYTMFANTEYGVTRLEVSAKNTIGTFSREPNPSDAVEVDVGMLTQTVDPQITGIGVIRDKVFLTFYDTSMLGKVGVFNGTFHEPDFSDVISLFGSFSHNTIVSLGNDIFCASNNGIVSVGVSTVSGAFVPDPISELIRPAYAAHIGRLSEVDLRLKTFAVFNSDDREYMLFIPKYSNIVKTCEVDPIYISPTFARAGLVILNAPNHQMEENDWIDLSGVTAIGTQTANMFNGRRKVRKVIDENKLLIEVSGLSPLSISGGGNAVQFIPVNDETICYVYTYNQALRVRRWTRVRGLNYRWATRSQKNSIFMGRGKKVYRKGTISHPITSRNRYDYDFKSWQNSKAYTKGQRVQVAPKLIYVCDLDHVSAPSGNFDTDNLNRPLNWSLYSGDPITWEVETPWSDFNERTMLKQIKRLQFDTRGNAPFKVEIFTDGIYKDPITNDFIPVASIDFTGHDSGGFGAGETTFGTGRRTAEEWLWSVPARGKVFKLRFSGTSLHPLTISAVSLSYLKGSELS